MRTVTVIECRTRGNARYWAWCLLKANPPGIDRTWFTVPGGSLPIGDFDAGHLEWDREVFTYTTRESQVNPTGGDGE